MRVTNGMVGDQVVFNMQRSLQRFMDLQTSMSSGRRINKPSDDPVGTVRALAYRDQIGAIEQHRKNIAEAQNWSSTCDNALAETKNFASTAKEIAVAMADGTYDATAREASANEIQSLFNQVVQMGNSELEGRRIFAGFRTKTRPISVYSNGVSYEGDNGKFDFEIEAASRLTVNLSGAEVFLKQLTVLGEKSDLNVGITAATPLVDLKNGQGVSAPGTFVITDRNRNLAVTIDLNVPAPSVTVGDVISRINTQLTAAGVTNLTAQLGYEGNNILFTSAQNGLISTTTELAKLNQGTGVDLNPGKIRVSNGVGVDLLVDLSGSSTIGEIITKFNTQMAAAGVSNVTMAVSGSGRALAITDSNGPPSLNLTITDVTAMEQTAQNLGISGAVGSLLTGHDVLPATDFAVAETTGTTAGDLGIVSRFSGNYAGQDVDARLTTTALVSSLRNRVGLDRSRIALAQGGTTATIDLAASGIVTIQDMLDAFSNSGLNVTARINATTRGIEIVNNDPARSLTIEEVGSGRTAKQMGIYGSGDLMGSLLVLNNALKINDAEGAGMLIGNFDDAIQNLLNHRATVGARAIRLSSTDTRLIDMNLEYTKLLSEAEDADIPKVVTDLASYENSYRAALMASSKIIQPSLLDFLK